MSPAAAPAPAAATAGGGRTDAWLGALAAALMLESKAPAAEGAGEPAEVGAPA